MSDLYSPEFIRTAYPSIWNEFENSLIVSNEDSWEDSSSWLADVMEPHTLRAFIQRAYENYGLPVGYECLVFLDRACAYECIVCGEPKSPTRRHADGTHSVNPWSGSLVCEFECYAKIWRECEVCGLSARHGLPCPDSAQHAGLIEWMNGRETL